MSDKIQVYYQARCGHCAIALHPFLSAEEAGALHDVAYGHSGPPRGHCAGSGTPMHYFEVTVSTHENGIAKTHFEPKKARDAHQR